MQSKEWDYIIAKLLKGERPFLEYEETYDFHEELEKRGLKYLDPNRPKDCTKHLAGARLHRKQYEVHHGKGYYTVNTFNQGHHNVAMDDRDANYTYDGSVLKGEFFDSAKGYSIYTRHDRSNIRHDVRVPIKIETLVFDIVKGGECVAMMAGPNGAKRFIESISC